MKFDVPNTDEQPHPHHHYRFWKAASTATLMKLVWSLVRPYKKWMLIIFVAMLVETLMSIATPWPLKILIDNVIGHHPLPGWLSWMNRVFPGENKIEFAAVASISVLVMAAIGSLATYLDSYFTESLAQYVSNDLRRRIYHHLQRLSLSYYDTHQTAKLLSVITSDVSTIQDFASSTLMNILVDSLTIVGMLGIMFYLNSGFTLVAIGITPFLLLFVGRFKKVMKKATHEVRVDQSNMLAVMQHGLESIRAVNAFGRQDLEEDKLKKASMETVSAALRARSVKSVLNPVITITVAACTAMVLWHGADLVLKGVMTVGSLTVFIWYMNKFFSPVQDLAKMTSTIAQATVALERIEAILDTEIKVAEKSDAVKPDKFDGDIVFDKVSFFYTPEAPVLDEVSFHIEKGKRVGICGPTGAGKSTILSLIARFYDTTAGQIYIDGKDITDFSLDGLRSQIAFVLQDTALFYGSVRENIAYGRPDAAEEEIIEASKQANAHEFISRMPHGYDTLVGERGLTLSGGQRQRIGIARALVRNSPILLLDEPTASLDTEAERIVMEALEKLMRGRTVVTIAHRLSTIADSDKIIVLHDGRVAEEGTHDELLAEGRIYAELYNVQLSTAHAVHQINS